MNRVGPDKQALLAAVVRQVEAKLEELRAGYEASRDAVLSTPHVMKSKREVFGQESAYLANALALNIQEREHELKTLRSLRLPIVSERVALGCVVGVGGTMEQPDAIYFLLPVCGGMEIGTGRPGPPVRVVTSTAPVARALLGRSLDDEVVLPTAPATRTTITLLH